jgi:dTDP-4-dehydrorhamnose reductase
VSLERVLITGGRGQLASDLEELLASRAEVRAPSRAELDVTRDVALEQAIEEHRPDTVFNCAAFHNLNVCEHEEDRSFAVNARAVKRLAELCAARGASLVHLSTNYVFDGARAEPYAEMDPPNPRSVYAISKLAGEHMALTYAPRAVVVRTAGLYGLHGSASKGGNFVTRMVARAREEGVLRMVADQRLTPTFTRDLAAALVEAVERQAAGVLHLTSSGECSWHEFTLAIMRFAGIDAPVEPIETEPPDRATRTGVERPLNGVLARPAADAVGIAPLRHWRDALADYMERAGLVAARQA